MPAQVKLTITQGSKKGNEYSYDSKEALIIGRNHDSNIVLPERTVSRYHCLVDINPPSIVVCDFGSLNGTFLNDKKIGQREPGTTPDEAKEQTRQQFTLSSGDTLGLGPDCQLTIDIKIPKHCSLCDCELTDDENETVSSSKYICNACFERQKAQEESKKKKALAQNAEPKQKKCEACGKLLSTGYTEKLCPECLQNPLKVLELLIKNAMAGKEEASKIKGYRNIRSLGKGAMGQVWLVEQEKSGQQMALKIMLPHVASNENSRNMFLREAFVSEQLRHRNIVTQFENGCTNNTYFILMEYCAGGNLGNLIRRQGVLDINYAVEIMFQVLDALDYTHNAKIKAKLAGDIPVDVTGVVHRDLKPDNIFLSGSVYEPIVKVADFGLAKAFEIAGLSGMTNAECVAGTLACMPRQQILNFRYSKPDVDVWAAAATFYYMLTGKYPKEFSNDKPPQLCVLNNKAIPIRTYNPNIPFRLAEVIDTALIDNPKICISSAAELKHMIEGAL